MCQVQQIWAAMVRLGAWRASRSSNLMYRFDSIQYLWVSTARARTRRRRLSALGKMRTTRLGRSGRSFRGCGCGRSPHPHDASLTPGYRRRMQMKTARSDPIVVPFVPVAAFLLVGFALHSGTLRCRLWGWQPSHLVLTPNSDCYVKAAHDWCDRLGGYDLRFSLVGRLTVVDA